jgi:hypothetical protein
MTLDKWGKDLLEDYFHNQDKNLVDRLLEKFKAIKSREEISRITGIKDKWILDKLMALGVQPQMLMALTLVPLIEVAWADGVITKEERETILAEADRSGVEEGSETYDLLSNWLETQPEPRLYMSWNLYAGGLCEEMNSDQIAIFRKDVLARAYAVAKASGGIPEIGKVSKTEKVIIEKLEAPFK